jgi:hypothetical protein
MIKIKSLIESDKDRTVMYIPSNNQKKAVGVITSWNDTFIFVCYDDTGRGQATRPDDLTFCGEK